MKSFFRSLALLVAFLTGAWLPAAERIPPAPARYFNDYAGVVSRPAADALNLQLEQYERESSNQLLVVVFPRMESDSSVEDYTVRVAQAWKAGQQGRNNGAVLFVFKDDHKLYLQVGYGLEATLTDAIASQIIERELKPAFRAGNFEAGLRAAVTAMIAATKGEYQGTGRTRAEHPRSSPSGPGAVIVGLLILLFFLFVIIRFIQFIRHGLGLQPTILGNPRRRTIVAATTPWWGGGGSSGNWGGGSGGGGGGFSGGGGSFGGGGAGGSW